MLLLNFLSAAQDGSVRSCLKALLMVATAATSMRYGCLNDCESSSPLDRPLALSFVSKIVSPITHFLTGWGVANSVPSLDKRERALVTWASVVPDLDGLGIIADRLTRNSAHPLNWWGEYHHTL